MAIVEDFTSRQEREVCYVSSTNAQLAVFRKEAGGVTYYALKKNGDDAFHRIAQQFPDSSNFVLLPNDTIIGSKQGGEGYKMFALSNFQEHASADAISSGTPNDYIVYELSTAAGTLFTDGVGNSFPVRHIAVSRNGKYAVAQTLGRGLARIDVTTRSVKIISNDYANSNAGVVLAISNDGNTVAVTGTGSLKHRVYVGLDDCGSINATSIIADRNMCYFADLSEAVASRLGDTVFYNPELSDDNRLLTIRAWSEAEQKARKLTFTPDADNYRLEYLAMGDSYSSGEGDAGRDKYGNTYYLPRIDKRGDDCHISLRSYPFLLREEWRITTDRMKSVACSGARVIPDFSGIASSYLGQSNRLNSESNLSETRRSALDKFTPGHLPQLEFVKKYQPKVVTFTGGGNDIGFESILEYCASPEFADFVPWVNSDCQYAVAGSTLHKMLIRSIDTQYFYNKKLVDDIKSASPQTKIVIIGYPQFIAANLKNCSLNSGLLSFAERVMLNTAVTYTNSMLKRLAYDTSVSYVDIENTLAGGRICERSSLMTGVASYAANQAARQEMFHPNAAAHAKIAKVIIDADVYKSEDSIPNAGSYVPSLGESVTRRIEMLRGGVTTWQAGLTLKSDSGILKPDSAYTITKFSSPKQLGAFTSSSDGSIDVYLSLQDAEIGRHVLMIEGVDNENRAVQLYQFIEIKAFDNDADGDGIPDNVDRCQYITEWYDEQMGENVCSQSDASELIDAVKYRKPTMAGLDEGLYGRDDVSPGKVWSGMAATRQDKGDRMNQHEAVQDNKFMASRLIKAAALIVIIGGMAYGYKKSTQK